MFKRFPIMAVGSLAICALPALAGVVDFNTPGDLTGKFALNTAPLVTNKFFQVASGGLANSGAVDFLNTTDSDHTTAVYNAESYRFTQPGDSVTVSQFLLRQDATQAQTPWGHLGIVSDLNERMDAGAAANSFASVRLEPGSPLASNVFLRIETKVNGGGRIRTTPGLSTSLVTGRWYLFSATFDYVSASSVQVSSFVEDWGTTGAALQSTVLTLSPTSVAVSGLDAVNGDTDVWSAFRHFHEGGTNLADTYTSTPEPATLTALMLTLLATRRLRRK